MSYIVVENCLIYFYKVFKILYFTTLEYYFLKKFKKYSTFIVFNTKHHWGKCNSLQK